MRLLVAKYPNGEIRLWEPEMQEFLEADPDVELLGFLMPPYAFISEPEPL